MTEWIKYRPPSLPDLPKEVIHTCRDIANLSRDRNKHTSPVDIVLMGSTAKGLDGPRSDMDIQIRYIHARTNLMSLAPHTFNPAYPDDMKEVHIPEKGKTIRVRYGKEWEVTSLPIFSGSNRSLLRMIAAHNGKVLHDLFVSPVVHISSHWTEKFMNDMLSRLRIPVLPMVEYLNGYMRSQLATHRRHKDANRRITRSFEEGTPMPTVKMVLEGIYIGMSCYILLRDGKVIQNFRDLYNDMTGFFDPAERSVIDVMLDYKTKGKPMNMPLDTFVNNINHVRLEFFRRLTTTIDDEYRRGKEWKLEGLPKADKARNIRIMDEFIRELYNIRN